jgi:hypothetical protein
MSTKAQVILDAANGGASDEELKLLEETHEDQFFDKEILGCTDPNATNYDPKATQDDGSCILPEETKEEETTITYEYPELEEVTVQPTPDEYFTVEPQFFGKQTKSGYKKTKTEEDAVEELNPQLSGLGMRVETSGTLTDEIKIITEEYDADTDQMVIINEEIIPMGIGLSGEHASLTNKDRSDVLNGIINNRVQQLQDPNSEYYNPEFDFDLYKKNYQIASAAKIEHVNEKGETQEIDIDKANFKQLLDHRDKIHLKLSTEFYESDRGKAAISDIDKEISTKVSNLFTSMQPAIYKAIAQGDYALEKISKSFEQQYANIVSEAWGNNKDITTMLANNNTVINSVFEDRLLKLHKKEKVAEEFGTLVSNSGFLTGLARTGRIQIPMAIEQFKAINYSRRIEKANETLEKISKMSDDDVYAYGYYDSNNPNLTLPNKNYKVSDLKSMLQSQIESHNQTIVTHLYQADEYQQILQKMPSPHLFKDGKLNISWDNYQEALGDQTAQLMFSWFTGSMSTMVQEAGGAFDGIVRGKAIEMVGEEKWESYTKDQKINAMLDIVKSGNADINAVMTVGGINTALDFSSNAFFVAKMALGPGASAATNSLKENFKSWFALMIQGRYKKALQNIVTKKGVKDISQTSLLEAFTEAGQEEVMNYGVGTSVGNYKHNFDQTFNAGLTALLTTPVLGGGTRTIQEISSEFSARIQMLNNPEGVIALARKSEKEYDQLLKDDKITRERYDQLMDNVLAAKKTFDPTNQQVRDGESAIKIFNEQLEIVKKERELAKLKDKQAKLKDENTSPVSNIEQIQTEAEILNTEQSIRENKSEQTKARKIDFYKTEGYRLANEINSNPDINENWEVNIFENTQGGLDFLSSIGIDPRLFKNFKDGDNAFILNREEILAYNPQYEGKGVAIISNENVINNINKGVAYAENAVHHELEHLLMDEKFKGEQGTTQLRISRDLIASFIGESKDPQIMAVNEDLKDRLNYYKSRGFNLNERGGIEEFFAALSDVTRGLSLDQLSVEGQAVFVKIGKHYKELLHSDRLLDVWGVANTIDFIKADPRGNENIEFDTVLDENGNPIVKLKEVRYSIGEDGRADMKLIDDTNPYPIGRSPEAISDENARLTELIKKQKEYKNPDNLELQEKVRAGVERYEQQLVYNNWGAFKKLINNNYDKSHPLNKIPGNEELFIGESLLQFTKGIKSYINKIGTGEKMAPFGAYYFGKGPDGKSIAEKRLVAIYDKLKKQFEEEIQPNVFPDPSPIDPAPLYEDYNEKSVIREGLPGMEENTENYNNWIEEQTNTMSKEEFDWQAFMTDPDALSKLDKKGKKFFKQLKNSFSEKIYKNYTHTQFYIDYITKRAKDIYMQMDQKTMNTAFTEFTEIDPTAEVSEKTGRLTVIGSKKKKQKDVKSDTAGNVPRRKLEWNDEIEAQFIERLLKTDQIERLRAEGKTTAEIHAIVRVDELHKSTLQHLSKILFRDAMMQTITSDAFKAANGIDQAEIARMALLIDKGTSVRFSLGGEDKTLAPRSPGVYYQQISRLQTVAEQYWNEDASWETISGILNQDESLKDIPQDAKDFVSSLYEKDFVERAEGKQFTADMKKNELISPEVRKQASQNIRGDAGTRQKMMDNAEIIVQSLPPELLNSTTLEFLGFHYRALDIAKAKQDGTQGEFYERYQNLLSEVGKLKEGDLDFEAGDIRIYNKDVPLKQNGIFKKLINILEQNKSKAAKIKEIEDSGLKEEIQKANIANIKAFKTITKTIAEQLKDGKLDEAALIQMYKAQSFLTFGNRGFSRLDGYLVLDGSQEGTNWKGEHAASISKVDADILDLIYRYKSDPTINLYAEMDVILAGYGQILGEKADFDTLDEAGQTNVTDTYRFNIWNRVTAEKYIGIENVSLKDMQTQILLDRDIKITALESRTYDETNLIPETVLVEDKDVIVNPVEFDNQGTRFSLGETFNKVLEDTEGMRAEIVFSEAQAKIRGKKSGGVLDVIYPASAYDFEMFTYKYMGKGELGEQQAAFFKEKLFDPYELAIQQIDKKKQAIRNDYKALVKELPQVRKNLKQNIEGTNYTIEQAIRVYTWSKNGMEIPGLSKRDQKMLISVVEADQELIIFSDKLSAISRQKEGYTPPSEYWTIEGISYDLTEMTGKVGRAKALAQWKENVSQIFSEENKNKLRVLYGNDHVEALEDMLYRMEYGRNKSRPGRIETQWNNWVNNSVGAIMFFNMRSAALQTISAANYMDWKNNNPANAALAFANQPQYWKDFAYIFNSDYLKERRAGNKRTINEAELSAHLKGSTNKAKAAVAWLLEKGFLPTQIADSFAIASGGAGYYRNQIKAYEKEGMSTKEAETQAWLDFRQKTEYGQQSSRPDLISQQQAGGLGRLILAFKNTPMQYNRLMIKAMADLKNGRGSTRENMSKIAYYGAVQNIIFTSLQTALFSALGDEDEWDTKKERVANGMIDSVLNGMGLTGAIAVTIKNGYLQYRKQKKRGRMGDQTYTLIQFANMSPTIGSKLRKLYGAITTEQYNKEAIEEMGFNLENPAFNSLANLISATTNIPLDRAVQKAQNIILASKSETEAMDSFALLMGYNPWDLGLETEAKKVKKEVKIEKEKEKKIQKEKEKEQKIIQQEQENIQKQKEEKKKGKKEITCAAVTSKGRCGLPVVSGKTKCTVHVEVEQRKDGKQVQCKKIKKNKERCAIITSNKSGFCYYHD